MKDKARFNIDGVPRYSLNMAKFLLVLYQMGQIGCNVIGIT